MKRLYVQVYLTVIVSLLIVVAAAGLMWRLAARASPAESAFQFAGEIAGAVLPAATEPAAVQKAALEKFAKALKTDLALFDTTLRPIAAAGEPLPPPKDWRESGGWMHIPRGHAWSISLDDGRWLVMRAPRHRPPVHPAIGLIGFLGAIAAGVALGAYPIVRRVTGRLERLEAGVVALGRGDLKTRVAVEGRDEIAGLAQSFNRAAERIEALVGAHKMLLANASHELRTPLARIRLGLEMLDGRPDPARQTEIARDIAELDGLIDEILLSSRLDAVETLDHAEEVDLLGLAAEEAVRYSACAVSGEPAVITGDPRLLRRLVRNLIENATRHGKPPVSVHVVRAGGSGATLTVTDQGPGVAPDEQSGMFEAFRRGAGAGSAGTGLGLALVRQIARRHGGEVAYLGRTAAGNVFTVDLPGRLAVAAAGRRP